ncbi:unnamed protein product [Coregonus sp. 'balchen']|nr:unnamed protein product [Coregonus sp. 'balchen']
MRKPKDTPRTSTDDRSSKSQSTTMAPSSIRSVKFTTELLHEARGIVGSEAEGQGQEYTDSQQRDPEESVATAMGLVRGRDRMVDEIIASLQIGGSDMSSVSDQMIKELMGRVLGDHRMISFYFYVGDSYNAENEGTPPVPQRMLLVKRETPTPPRPVESPKVTSEVYKMADSLSERIRVSQALPLELASRICHTSSQLTAPPPFHQKRTALQHICTQPDRHRPLCSNELKIFWHPVPPKFSCSPAFVNHKLFPGGVVLSQVPGNP